MESISAIIFGLLLMLPLFVQLQMLVLHPRKLLATLRCYLTESTRDVQLGERNLVQHYPKLPDLLNSNSNSESSMMVWTSPRTVFSSPAIPRVGEHRHQFVRKTIPLARHSSSYVATQIELPVVDITCNYNSYRYSTLEENLRERYGANYPPGEVVLNYIQLNTPDSRTRLGNDVGNDLLDLFEGSDAGTYSAVSTKLETEYLNLLDHFVLKRPGKTLTAGKFTETLPFADERNVEVSSVYAGTCSQSTLRSSVAQEKESRSSSNQRSLKGLYNNRALVYSNGHPEYCQRASHYSSYTVLHSRHYNGASRPRLNTNRREYNVKGSVHLARRHSRNRHRPCSE